jgi:hypothetical protein
LALMLLTISDCVLYAKISVKVFATFSSAPHLIALYISHELFDLTFGTNPKLVGRVRDESFVVTTN